VSRWFDEYLEAFASCGRGESETASLLAYYGVPLLLTTDDRFLVLASGDQIIAAVQGQIDGMRAAGFARTEVLSAETSVVNSKSALLRETFVYRRNDGGEIRRLTATYLITVGASGMVSTRTVVLLTPEEGVTGDGWSRRPPRDVRAQITVMWRDVAALIANGQPLTAACGRACRSASASRCPGHARKPSGSGCARYCTSIESPWQKGTGVIAGTALQRAASRAVRRWESRPQHCKCSAQ